MRTMIDIPAGRQFGGRATIRPAFSKTGIPGYFMLAAEIPQELMDATIPERDYKLILYSHPPARTTYQNFCRLPTVSETLWAIGWMNVELAGKISEAPMRFLHRPFRLYECPRRKQEPWRQILVRRSDTGYSVETVPANAPVSGAQLAYVFNP